MFENPPSGYYLDIDIPGGRMNTMVTLIKAQRRKNKENTILRNSGFIPAVVYGFKTDSQSIAIDEKDLAKTLREIGKNGVMRLDLDGKEINVILNDYQMNILQGKMIHVDFLAINMKDELEVNVPVTVTGTSEGVSQGGLLQQPNREITIVTKPSNIPEAIEVDVTGLAIGDTLMVGDIRKKVKYPIVQDDEFTLVTVLAPKLDTEPEEVEDTSEVQENETTE